MTSPEQHASHNNIALLYVTYPDAETANHIARVLVEEKLIACANILGEIGSVYRWEGQASQVREVVTLHKTTRAREAEATARIQALHPYTNPAILTLPVIGGAEGFLAWVARETAAEISD